MNKIVIIGAGSLAFSSRLTADILTYPDLNNSLFHLVDIDEERLTYAERIVKKIFQEGGYHKAEVRATTNRKEALLGADFVITSILVGGYEAIEQEIDIPMKYGIDQCIGDTLTPGGIMRCLRTLPVLLDIVRDIMEICPEAHLLNYTNPMGMLSLGISNFAPELSYVGLCHSVQHTSEEWARRLETEIEDVDFICAGINHQAWFTSFRQNAQDLLPRMRELAEDPGIWNGDSTRMELLKHFGFPVTESSGHASEYSWWFRKDAETVARYCRDDFSEWNGTPGFIKTLYNRPDWKERMEKMASWENPVDLERSYEYGSVIINSLVTGTPSVIHGNVPNKGYISNLPEGSLVEVPCLIDKNGIQPVRVGEIPPALATLNSLQLGVQELAVKAVETGDPEYVFQAMAMDPLCSMSCTLDEIRDMTVELLEAHKEWISCLRTPLKKSEKIYLKEIEGEVGRHIDPAAVNQS